MQNPTINRHIEDVVTLIKNTGPGCLASIDRPFQIRDIDSYNDAMYFWSQIARYLYHEQPQAKLHFFEFLGISEVIFNPYKYKTSWDIFARSPVLSLLGAQIDKSIYGWNESKIFVCFFLEMKIPYFVTFKNETAHAFAQDDEEIRSIISYEILEKNAVSQVKIPFAMLLKVGVEI